MFGQRPLVKSMSRGLFVLGRLCLIASLWHAPVPMMHSHGSDIDESQAATATVEHLTEYHAGVPVDSHVEFGWHVHFVLLADPEADEPCDEDGQPDRAPFYDPFIATQAEVGLTLAIFTEWQSPSNWFPPRVDHPVLIGAATGPPQFLGTYLDAVPLRILLRVARC